MIKNVISKTKQALRAPSSREQLSIRVSKNNESKQPPSSVDTSILASDLKTDQKITWCPGCGNFGIFLALKNALQQLGVAHQDVFVVYGIGCHGHMCDYLNAYGFEGLHGRAIPLATGAKLANPKLKVIVVAGDGDTYGEGLNHFLSAARANHDITVIVHNNMVYGLTTGQTSPTSEQGFKTKSTPSGVLELPVNPLALSLTAGAGFVSRGFGGNVAHLTEVFLKALSHNGFSHVDVLQNCVTFNHVNTIRWFSERVYKLGDEQYDPSDKWQALRKAVEWGERIPIGVLYQDERQSYEDALQTDESIPPHTRTLDNVDISELFSKYS